MSQPLFDVPLLQSGPIALRGAQIRSLGIYRPDQVVTNTQFAAGDDPQTWIEQRTGITERRYARPHESVVSMAVAAACEALEVANVSASEVDTVILATSTYGQLTPPAATAVSYQLGAAQPAAFDISAGCAGFSHALALAADLVAAGSSDHVLVIGSEKLSSHLDPSDLSTAPLFGDGAGAVLVSTSTRHGVGPVVWGSDGSKGAMIAQYPSFDDYCQGTRPRLPALAMDGPGVYRWARRVLPQIVQALIEQLPGGSANLSAFIPHQANGRIISAAANELGLPESVAIAADLVTAGNTSAASIPLAMHRILERGQARPGDIAALVGFGAGLCWAGQLVYLPQFRSSRHHSNRPASGLSEGIRR